MSYLQSIIRAIDFMESHLTDDISLIDVAEAAHFSHWHFQRIFREALGESIGSYLRRRRLACAYEDLCFGQERVIDVAIKFQFGSSEAFSRSFKEEFGVSPLQSRKNSSLVKGYRKPALDGLQVSYIVQDLMLTPEIKEVPAVSVVGLLTSFISPLSKRSAYLAEVTTVWKDFVRRQNEVPELDLGIKVGIILGMASQAHHIHDEMMDYIAAAPMTEAVAHLPEGFTQFDVPAGRYAVFTAKGFHEQTQFIIDYVYSTWLPQSEYERGDGVEFTLLDHRCSPLSPVSSCVQYFFPLKVIQNQGQ